METTLFENPTDPHKSLAVLCFFLICELIGFIFLVYKGIDVFPIGFIRSESLYNMQYNFSESIDACVWFLVTLALLILAYFLALIINASLRDLISGTPWKVTRNSSRIKIYCLGFTFSSREYSKTEFTKFEISKGPASFASSLFAQLADGRKILIATSDSPRLLELKQAIESFISEPQEMSI